MSSIVTCVILILAAYLIGSISGSLLLGRLRGVDIRSQGSGNAGGTNAFRNRGVGLALAVVVVDIGKGALATWLALRLAPHDSALAPTLLATATATALAAVIGHVWPLWHGFRGGKGVGTLLGGVVVLWPGALPWLLLVWLCVLVASGHVGLASMLAWMGEADSARRVFACAAAARVLFTHRGNVQRLRDGSESRFERVRIWGRRA